MRASQVPQFLSVMYFSVKTSQTGRSTYINTYSTFCNFKLKDSNLVINKDWFTVTPRNNEIGGVHGYGCRIVADCKDKLIIRSAL